VRFLSICSVLLVLALPSAHSQTTYVGLRYPPLPFGLYKLGGYMTGWPEDSVHSITQIDGGTSTMLWLERIQRDAKDSAVVAYEVKAVLVPPAPGPDQALMLGTCALGGFDKGGDSKLVAIATFVGDSANAKRVDRAWRVDLKSERFVEIPTKGLVCFKDVGSE
jgi:hypothetical protein